MSDREFMLLNVDYKRHSRSQFLIRVLVVAFAVILGFIVISLILSSNSPQLVRPKFKTECTTNYDYDFDLLTLRWPPSICTKEEECPQYQKDKWVVHGLWPTYNNNSWPQFCCFDRQFHAKELEPIRQQLINDWPNLESKKTENSLWAHEWTKHGTCTKTKQIIYFNSTLNLYKMFHIFEWLKESNIIPSDDITYSVSQISDVLVKKLGHSVMISCPLSLSENNQVSKGIQLKSHTIKEIRICISRNTSEVIDCKQPSECNKPLIYPKSQNN